MIVGLSNCGRYTGGAVGDRANSPISIQQSTFSVPSICVLLQPAEKREAHDLDVERDRPVLDVIQIVLDPLFQRRVAAPAVDLCPARDPGFHLVTKHVLRDAMLELLDEVWTFRTR